MSTRLQNEKSANYVVAALSIVIPSVVAFLLFSEKKTGSLDTGWWQFLPALNAAINTSVTVLLIAGKILIRKGKRETHKMIMLSATFLSVVFLVSYILYHYKAGDVKYGGDGADRYFYLILLSTHILMSIVVVPLVLLSLFRGLGNRFDKHRKIVKWSWPVWMYVSVTGVLVYLFAHVFNPGY